MSAKTSSQAGRRTPLSLSGAGSKAAGSKGNVGTNGLSQSPSSKAENKKSQQQQQQVSNNMTEIKDSAQQPAAIPNRRQASCSTDSGKKVENTQNGMGNISQNTAATAANANREKLQPPQQQQQQQQQKEPQPSTNNDNKEKNVKTDKSEKKDKIEKVEKMEKMEKMEKISRSEKGKEKMEKKSKEENIANAAAHSTAKSQNKEEETKISEKLNAAAEEAYNKNEVKKEVEKEEEEQMHPTPKIPKEERKLATPTKSSSKVTAVQAKQKKKLAQDFKQLQKSPAPVIVSNEAAAIIPAESMEMETVIIVDDSPRKTEMEDMKPTPSATSTPDKEDLAKKRIIKITTAPSTNSEIELAMQSGYFIERPRNLAQITGRRSIRPITDYTPSRFQFDLQYRESYRRINTDLDDTCSSMNVTVGSEVHNNSSFSFFSRGRKRTSRSSQPTDTVVESPAKKARLDFCSVLLSPITMLRNRFSRTTIQSSTPLKIKAKTQETTEEEDDNEEVQNVSGVAMQDDLLPAAEAEAINDNNEIAEADNAQSVENVLQTSNTVIDEDGNNIVNEETKDTSDLATQKSSSFEYQQQPQQQLSEDSDKEIKENPGSTKKERCILM